MYNKTPIQFLTEQRIEQAKKSLRQNKSPITEIATNVGYYDSIYFAYVFKKYTGMTPSQYRKIIDYK